MNGASQDDVKGAFENPNGDLRLGGARVTNTEVEVKLEESDSDGAGHAFSCSVLLALVLSMAVILA